MTNLQLEALEGKKQYWMHREVIVSGERFVRGKSESTMDEGVVIGVRLSLSKLILDVELSDGRVVTEPASEVMIKRNAVSRFR